MSYSLACSGTVMPPSQELAILAIDFSIETIHARYGRPAALVSGCAYGIDTLWALRSAARWKKSAIILVVPAAGHNQALPKLMLDRFGKRVSVIHMPPAVDAPKAYMERNDKLQECAEILAAHPEQQLEVLRSGTWATVRRFRKAHKPVFNNPVMEGGRAEWL